MQWLQHELWSSRLTMQISKMELFWYVSYSRVSGEEVHAPVIHEFVLHVSCKDGEYIGIKNMSAWSHVVGIFILLTSSVLLGQRRTMFEIRQTFYGDAYAVIKLLYANDSLKHGASFWWYPHQRCDSSIWIQVFKDVNINDSTVNRWVPHD